MTRWPLGALLLFLAALPLRAQVSEGGSDQKGPDLVAAGSVSAQVDQLRDAVASPSVDDDGVRAQASAFFAGVPGETPLMRPARRVMDREPVDGHVGSIEGMVDEAQKRWDHYRLTTTDVPDARLDASIAYAKELFEAKRVSLDPKMAENQMGEFSYSKDKTDDGVVKLNARMPLMATRIGEAFCYATLVHEATHAKARAEGRLDPAHTIDNEVEAYRVQYLWVKVIDPSAERMIVLHSELTNQLRDHPDDQVSRLSLSYIKHLLELWDTGGKDQELRGLIKRLGYQDGGGVAPGATPIRA
ncbi:MAG TPA: hypothetical protein VH309_02435 [Elusimicrobiota bacterium]|jgi:hypothetical protein|nr:hypothetical protein [Elusimicrobiota bacterium]